MVAIIKTSTSIRRTLAYNENKVKQGVGQCLAAVNYPKEADELTFSQKLNLLTRQLALNERVTRGSVHISVNFDPKEKLSKETLIGIAQVYMDTIGFGDQPYLVYQHQDAAHPHLHIVSIKVRADGSRIDMQNMGRNQSEKARKQIEMQFGLVPASGSKQKPDRKLDPTGVTRAIHGKDQTKKAMETVLDFVLKNYRYTSLTELNVVLRKYNVLADRGKQTTNTYQNKGLLYQLIDKNGRKVGVPIKASALKGKPTLKFLESHFSSNRISRKPYQGHLKARIDWVLAKPDLTLEQLVKALAKEGIDLVLQRNAQGMLYGITYVDHRSRCVFKGSDLGKAYSAKSVAGRFGQSFSQKRIGLLSKFTQSTSFVPWKRQRIPSSPTGKSRLESLTFKLLGERPLASTLMSSQEGAMSTTLMQPEHAADYVPKALKKTKRKRKKRKTNPASNNS